MWLICFISKAMSSDYFAEWAGYRYTKVVTGIYEPPHGKTNNMACVPSPVFAVRMKKPGVLSYHKAHSEDSEQTG